MLRSTIDAEPQTLRAAPRRRLRSMLSEEQFRWALERESQRVDRLNAGGLTLVLFRVAGGWRRRSTLRLARTILSRVRVTDDVGWFDQEHVGLLLPETSPAGAWQLAQSISDIVANFGPRPLCTMYNHPAPGEDEEADDTVVRSDTPEQLKAAS